MLKTSFFDLSGPSLSLSIMGGMGPFAKCMQDSRIARAPPPPIHSFASFLEREREKEGSAIEIGDGQSASSTAAAANDDDDDDVDITGA